MTCWNSQINGKCKHFSWLRKLCVVINLMWYDWKLTNRFWGCFANSRRSFWSYQWMGSSPDATDVLLMCCWLRGWYLQSCDCEQRVAQSSRFRPGNDDTRAEFQEVGTSSLPSERWKSFRGLRYPIYLWHSQNHSFSWLTSWTCVSIHVSISVSINICICAVPV